MWESGLTLRRHLSQASQHLLEYNDYGSGILNESMAMLQTGDIYYISYILDQFLAHAAGA